MKNSKKQPETPLYHVTNIENRDAILREGLKARAGSWHKVTWKARVFLTTTRAGAYEIAHNFMYERGGTYLFILVDPRKVRGTFRPDREYDKGLWISIDVPPEAIVGMEAVDEDYLESRQFLAYMGTEDEEE